MTSPIIALSGAATDAGLRRSLNEDSFLSVPPVFLVADGMGGHDRGEVASATAIAEFAVFAGRDSLTIDDVREALARARAGVESLSDDSEAGAGTTLTGVVVAVEMLDQFAWRDDAAHVMQEVGDETVFERRYGNVGPIDHDAHLARIDGDRPSG